MRELFEQDRAALAEEPRLFLEVPPERMRAELRRMLTELPLVKETRFREDILGQWDAWRKRTNEQIEAELKRLDAERPKLAERRAKLEDQGQQLPEEDQRRLEALDFQTDLGVFEQAVRAFEGRVWETAFPGLKPEEQKERQDAYRTRGVPAGVRRAAAPAGHGPGRAADEDPGELAEAAQGVRQRRGPGGRRLRPGADGRGAGGAGEPV
jgi:hypothetical protein